MKSQCNNLEMNENVSGMIRLMLELQTELDVYQQENGYYERDVELTQLVRSLEVFLMKLSDS